MNTNPAQHLSHLEDTGEGVDEVGAEELGEAIGAASPALRDKILMEILATMDRDEVITLLVDLDYIEPD